MNKGRFDRAFDRFTRRPEEKVSPRSFFQILAEIERECAGKPIEVGARMVGGQLEFEPLSEVRV